MVTPTSTVIDERRARRATRRIVGKSESIALIVQAGNIILTANVDKVTSNGQMILYALAVLHVLGAYGTTRTSGPFERGGPWLVLWLGMIVAMPLIMAHLVGANEYGAGPACVQLCGYPAAPLALFAFYPWWTIQYTRYSPLLRYGILAVVVIEPFLLVLYLHQHVGPINISSAVATGLINILAFIAGKGVGKMCSNALDEQIKWYEENVQRVVNKLHVEIKDRIIMIRRVIDQPEEIEYHLQEMVKAVGEGNVEMALTSPRVPLADLFSRRVTVFDDQIELEVPRIGLVTADREAAIVLDQALADFLTNCVRYGATSARVNFRINKGMGVLEVCDNGEGFPSTKLDDESTALNRLRKTVRELGGDLYHSGTSKEGGACVTLAVPLNIPER